MDVVVVTPVFEDRESARVLFKQLASTVPGIRVVAVDDGSVREPLDEVDLRQAGLGGVVLHLRRNLGHQRAIAVGMGYVADHEQTADAIVIMDSDGEDAPSAILRLMEGFSASPADVRVAERGKRSESLRFILGYKLYKLGFRCLTGQRITFGNFMALKPSALRRMAAMNESWSHLAASILLSHLQVEGIPVDRARRYAGQSRMNFSALVLHGLRGVMVFKERVLLRLAVLCLCFGTLGAALAWFVEGSGALAIPTATLFLLGGIGGLLGGGWPRVDSLIRIDYRDFIRGTACGSPGLDESGK